MYNIQDKTKIQNILLVGFNDHAMTIRENMGQYFSAANFQAIDRLVDQSVWLGENGNETATQAIVCDYDYMEKHDFMFLRNLQNNPSMRKIPFILVNKNNMPLNVNELLQLGVDDCYGSPIDWNGMKTRIHFLEKYKPFIISKADQWDDNPLQ